MAMTERQPRKVKMDIECPYGYVANEEDPLPCQLTDKFDCKCCVLVGLTEAIRDLQEEGLNMFVVAPQMEEVSDGQVRRQPQ